MENNIKINGKFYLNNGIIIEEEVIFDEDNTNNDIENFIRDIKKQIKEGFKSDINFQFTFGYTMFRGKDISAVTFTVSE